MAYCLKAAVKSVLGITDTTYDSEIDDIIDRTDAAMDSYCGRTFVRESVVEYHDGGGISPGGIALNREPSEATADRAAATLVEDGVSLTVGTDWFLSAFPSRMVYRMDGSSNYVESGFASGYRNVVVTYWTSYQTLPNDIVGVSVMESARSFLQWNTTQFDGGRLGVTQKSPESGTSLSYAPDDISAASQRVLDSYRANRFE